MASPVNAQSFYGFYHGHRPEDLARVLVGLKADGPTRPVIYLLGDSSLDNKAWLPAACLDAHNGYERVLDPPLAVGDVAHCMNTALAAAPGAPPLRERPVVVNAAVEESTLGARRRGAALLPQDELVRDALTPRDVLVVSVGGNDIALRPSVTTAASMGWLARVASQATIDDGSAMGLGHLVRMFRDDVGAYVAAVCARAAPRLVVVCMVYAPHEARTESWANPALAALGYDSDPRRLQSIIRAVYARGTRAVAVPGVPVAACPLFEVLDPSPGSGDYVARVEPSLRGGRKMAAALLGVIQSALAGTAGGGWWGPGGEEEEEDGGGAGEASGGGSGGGDDGGDDGAGGDAAPA